MPEVSPAKARRLNANAGRPDTRYFEIGSIQLGQWYQMKFGNYRNAEINGRTVYSISSCKAYGQ